MFVSYLYVASDKLAKDTTKVQKLSTVKTLVRYFLIIHTTTICV